MARWLLLLAAITLLAGCGGRKGSRPPPPPPPAPIQSIVHTDPVAYLDGGVLAPEDIELRVLHCGWESGKYEVSALVPESGVLPFTALADALPELYGRNVWCMSQVRVQGVYGPPSNEVFFQCGTGVGPLRCWRAP